MNSTYEPHQFISYRKMVNLVMNGKVEVISSWDEGFKHGEGYDFVCGANLRFYKSMNNAQYNGKTYKFCSDECTNIFKLDPKAFLVPSIVRLKTYAPRHIKKRRYCRSGIFKRDKYTCQYCEKSFHPNSLTIDHVVPKDMGGKTTWENCVASCHLCNNKKANKTPKMAGMKLLHKPFAVTTTMWHEYDLLKVKHDDWGNYFDK